ncbi:hypothetical protein CHLNCDRAFT_23819 [Chlorella variabilis]|uniref:tRNA-dihydrouridine synthase n=1 Tax=Chlorella variabilis TaxID=554065 RepID=E1ZGG3_CHLVA|nr:hypothetical protein CHLNCDRAFT_23819 [Chlorella variabilis]EFN54753.1 hypothetical protein CHLNCDRAFT_23819 [Chlorella variabilis]|eukprot:XP_005846855.1 hypothetical protein CHLNCDRAFT_23819 [Chlorella variabilis]
MDWTDLYYRQLARLISRHTWLYTEMVVDQTIIHTPFIDKFLWFPPEQHPIVCQLGGSDPTLLARAAAIVERYGYDEINLNCGCPSDRVAGAGCFGAAMMLRPQLVADCCKAMREAVLMPITVKCRLGVDSFDSYPQLVNFVEVVSKGSGVSHFVIHARKCLLKGLNPHQNRTVPPLRYEWVWALKRDFPHLEFSLNGGVLTLEEVASALALGIMGVMVGRAAYNMPWDALGDADRAIFGAEANAATSRRQVLHDYAAWADSMIGHWRVEEDGHKSPNVRMLVKPLLGMFHGEPRAKKWRAAVDAALKTAETVGEVLDATLPVLKPESLDAPPRPLGEPPQLLEHYAAELPPTPEGLASGGDMQQEAAEPATAVA